MSTKVEVVTVWNGGRNQMILGDFRDVAKAKAYGSWLVAKHAAAATRGGGGEELNVKLLPPGYALFIDERGERNWVYNDGWEEVRP